MPSDHPLIVSDAGEAPEILRARFQQWGYLHFKQYASEAKCSALLSDILTELNPYVGLDEASQFPVLKGQPFVETDSIWDEVYPKIQSLKSFHEFFHTPDLLALMRTVSDSEVFVYPMKMARISTPGKVGYETPPHQDARSHVAGNTMAGIWVALHDISVDMGRLKILPASHKRGMREVVSSPGVGNVQCEIYPDETVWHVSDVTQGDIIIFNAFTVHAAQPNNSPDIVRMSVDTRFCNYGAPVFSSNLEPHHGWRIEGLDWHKIYSGWTDSKLQYYWADYPNLT